MLTDLTHLPYSDRLIVPGNKQDLVTNDVLERMALVHPISSGFFMHSPILQKVQERIEEIAMDESRRFGFEPITLPFLMPSKLLEPSGKNDEYGHEFYKIKHGSRDFLMAPTTEEAVITYLENGGLRSYKQLPMRFSHPHHVFRDIKRPEGIFKSRDFRAVLLSSFDTDQNGYVVSAALFNDLCRSFFERCGIEAYQVTDQSRQTIEYLFPCDIGDRPLEKSVVLKKGDGAVQAYSIPDDTKLASIAMGYEFDRVASFTLRYADNHNQQKIPVMGTYGIGVQRCTYALFQKASQGCKASFNAAVRPFDIMVCSVGSANDPEVADVTRKIADSLSNDGHRVALDNRDHSLSRKFALADFLSIPIRIPLGVRDTQRGTLEMRQSDGMITTYPAIDEVRAAVKNVLQPS